MGQTVPNQKNITIHKVRPKVNFLQISNPNWMEFNKKYGPFALQVYLYFSKNADNYTFALSQNAAVKEAGIKKTTFHKYVDLLIAEGYLVKRSGNMYDFYETPHKKGQKDLECSAHGELSGSQGEYGSSFHEYRSSQEDIESLSDNKEIDNTYKDTIDKGIDIPKQEGEGGNSTESKFVF